MPGHATMVGDHRRIAPPPRARPTMLCCVAPAGPQAMQSNAGSCAVVQNLSPASQSPAQEVARGREAQWCGGRGGVQGFVGGGWHRHEQGWVPEEARGGQ